MLSGLAARLTTLFSATAFRLDVRLTDHSLAARHEVKQFRGPCDKCGRTRLLAPSLPGSGAPSRSGP
jgi:hypothetical protein